MSNNLHRGRQWTLTDDDPQVRPVALRAVGSEAELVGIALIISSAEQDMSLRAHC